MKYNLIFYGIGFIILMFTNSWVNIQNSKKIYENRIQNQTSLFLDDSQKISYLIQDKNSSSWPNNEVLSKEFESVGFYLSNHPLEDYQDALNQHKVKLPLITFDSFNLKMLFTWESFHSL